LTEYLYEEGNPLEGNPNRYRLTLRERDATFFRIHVQDSGKLATLVSLKSGKIFDSHRNIKTNAELFLNRLNSLGEERRVRLAQFLVRHCLLVVVSTPDLDAAYRIFSILNDRGLDLSHSDILKSEIIGRIPPTEQEDYNKMWEDAEEDLGRQAFGELFSYIRMIYRKHKMRSSILKEFREHVINVVGSPKTLIDSVLVPFANALSIISTAGYESTEAAEQVNGLLRWLSRIDNTDWIPPALLFLAKNGNDAKAVKRFLLDLERLAAFMMLTRVGINDRLDRYGKLLASIEENSDIYDNGSLLQLTDAEAALLLRDINGDVYRQTAPRRLYLLLRLDSALSDGSATYNHGVISIEHVLPQTPPESSQWCKWFVSESQRDEWVHRIGNLVLLTHTKNSSASNYEFSKKKTAYFVKHGVSPFPLTTKVLTESEWTPEVLERHQRDRLETLNRLWRLKVDLSELWDEEDRDEEQSPEIEDDTARNASFHAEIIPILEEYFGGTLNAGPNRTWSLSDSSTLVSCQVSKRYKRKRRHFWFGLKRSAKERLEKAQNAFCAFGLGSPHNVLLLPYDVIAAQLNKLRISPDEDGAVIHWHIEFQEDGGRLLLSLSGNKHDSIDVSEHILKTGSTG
jgi:hypothetical protein